MEGRVQDFIRNLAARGRVLVLGGHAVIQHGLNRNTIDTDIWFEPRGGPDWWAEMVRPALDSFPQAYLWDLARRERFPFTALSPTIQEWGVARVGGLNQPLDLFRRPNNFEEADFDSVWERARRLEAESNIRVLHEIDLIASKESTERESDRLDIAFLEGKVRQELAPILAACDLAEAQSIFARYADHETCRAALRNPDAGVRDLAARTLREFADAGNPFAREMLAEVRGENG